MTDFRFIIDPKTQKWVDRHVFSVYTQVRHTKVALLPSKDFVPNLSIKQTNEGYTTGVFETAYSTTETKAKHWLLSTIADINN